MSQQERDSQPGGWAMAYRFQTAAIARRAYEAVRDAVLVDDDADASVFRFMVGGASYVALVAEVPPAEEEQRKAAALLAGEGVPAPLPTEVLRHLLERRWGFKSTGFDYLERRS